MAGQTRRGIQDFRWPKRPKKEPDMEHLTVQANNAAFHIAKIGTGQPLLLLHGWPEFWLSWEPVMTRLADRFTLYAPDLRGFGASGQPGRPHGPHPAAHDL